MRNEFSELKSKLPTLWTRSYYIESVGHISEDTIKKYIEDLMGKPKEALSYFNRAMDENPDIERAMYERAIAADSYFKDLQTRMNYYQEYLDQFKERGSPNILLLAKQRMQDIREEIHMSGSGAGME